MAGREIVFIVGVSPVPKTHLQETNQDRITDLVTVPSSELVRPSKHIPEKGIMIVKPIDLLVSLQGSPGAKVENGGFECWTSFSVERAQLPVQETETKMGDRERCNKRGDSRIVLLLLSTTRYI